MARYLVTGGAGFIGSGITAALLARGDAVTVLDDFSSGRESNLAGLGGDLDVQRGDVSVADDVTRAMRDVAAVFHEAAIPSVVRTIEAPLRADQVNLHGVVQVLEAARHAGVRRVIFAASAAAYGDDPELPKREDMVPRPLSPYAVAKIAGEQYLRVYASLFGMETVSLRYFNVFGPKQDPRGGYAAAIPRFVEAFANGRQPTIYGDGEQTRDFCHIDDVVAANLAALAAPSLAGEIVNIARGESTTVRDLVTLIARLCGTEAKPAHEPERPGDIRHSRADVSRAAALLGFRATVTVEEGLRATVAAFARGAVA